MTDPPWSGDACSLVEAYRRGEHSPADELTACLSAIDANDLNAFSHVHREQAIAAAANADITKPFGGVPIGIKELDQVAGWPDTHASMLYRDASPIARAPTSSASATPAGQCSSARRPHPSSAASTAPEP